MPQELDGLPVTRHYARFESTMRLSNKEIADIISDGAFPAVVLLTLEGVEHVHGEDPEEWHRTSVLGVTHMAFPTTQEQRNALIEMIRASEPGDAAALRFFEHSTTVEEPPTLFWVGPVTGGSYNDPSNWSLTEGGPTLATMPEEAAIELPQGFMVIVKDGAPWVKGPQQATPAPVTPAAKPEPTAAAPAPAPAPAPVTAAADESEGDEELEDDDDDFELPPPPKYPEGEMNLRQIVPRDPDLARFMEA